MRTLTISVVLVLVTMGCSGNTPHGDDGGDGGGNEPVYGEWSACETTTFFCATGGVQYRDVTEVVCEGTTCEPRTRIESRDCTRETDGELCVTVPDGSCCSGECVDLKADARHCGGCGDSCLAAADGCCATGRCGTVTLYGIDGDVAESSLYRFSLQDASATRIGPLGPTARGTGDFGLTFVPQSRTLYATHNISVDLLAVDPTTGAATAVGPLGIAVGDPGMAFDPLAHRAYLISEAEAVGMEPSNKVWELNLSTGAASLLCTLPIDMQNLGLAFDVANRILFITGYLAPLYAMRYIADPDCPPDLVCTMDEVCPAATTETEYRHKTGLAWNPIDGLLYAADSEKNLLLRWTPSTCAIEVVGKITPSNVEGIEFGCALPGG